MQSRVELEQENERIEAELAQVREALLAKESVLEKKEAFIEQLKEALILARNARFASSSESFHFNQQDLFNEAEQEVEGGDCATSLASDGDNIGDDIITVAAHQRLRRGRKPLLPELPRVDVIYDLAEADKICPHDGHELTAISDKISEQLDIIPMKIQVIRHIRKQYACPCCDGYLKTASKPKQPIEKSQASAGLLAYIATSKYADGLPLYRQSTILERFGIEMDALPCQTG
jgi:transposase